MKDIPKWITDIVETDSLRCNKCKDRIGVDCLISIGIQESSVDPHNDKLSIGMYCSDCREITVFEIKEMSLVEFAFEILERETKPRKSGKVLKKATIRRDVLEELSGGKKRETPPRSKITKKELNESIRFLKNVKTHEEFLIAMGMSPGQIDKYNYKKTKKE